MYGSEDEVKSVLAELLLLKVVPHVNDHVYITILFLITPIVIYIFLGFAPFYMMHWHKNHCLFQFFFLIICCVEVLVCRFSVVQVIGDFSSER